LHLVFPEQGPPDNTTRYTSVSGIEIAFNDGEAIRTGEKEGKSFPMHFLAIDEKTVDLNRVLKIIRCLILLFFFFLFMSFLKKKIICVF
jgi:hypothetical protein